MSYKTGVFRDDKVPVALNNTTKQHLFWLLHHLTDDRCLDTSYTLSITLKTLHRWTYHQHNSTSKKDLGPSDWRENSVILWIHAHQTIKKWGHSTWGRVVGTDNLSTRAAKCMTEIPENTWNKYRKAKVQWRCRIPDLLSAMERQTW